MKYYYLINNNIKSTSKKLPSTVNHNISEFSEGIYEKWLNSLEPVNINKNEFNKLIKYLLKNPKIWATSIYISLNEAMKKPIEISDIIHSEFICGLGKCVDDDECCISCLVPKYTIKFKEPKQPKVNEADTALRNEILNAFSWVSSIGEQFFDATKTVEEITDIYLSKRNK